MSRSILRRVMRAGRPEPEPDFSTMSPADAVFRRAKKHGHRTLALRAAAKMEARAPAAGAPTSAAARPGTEAAPAGNAKPSRPVKPKPAPPLPLPPPALPWDGSVRWRPRGVIDYDDDADAKPHMTIHDYDPLDYD